MSRTSRYLALVLRHDPGRLGLVLDEAGWVDVEELLAALTAAGMPLDRGELEQLVAEDPKQRYALAGARIRANQGHSVPVDLGLVPLAPPPVLFHGTSRYSVERILRTGLHRAGRHHVHLSPDVPTAVAVGARRGPYAVLEVAAAAMAADGHVFFRSANGVWLTDAVPPQYLTKTGGE